MGIVMSNFSTGWQNKARRELMLDTSVYICEDLDVANLGSLRCRLQHKENSYFKTITGIITGSIVYALYMVNVEGAGHRLIYYVRGGHMWRYDSYTKDTDSIASGASVTGHFSYAALKPVLSNSTYVYITNGTTMLCDNGVNTYTWGIDPPSNAPYVDMQGSGGMLSAGGYSYRYTFYDSATGAESDPSSASVTTTAVANDEALVSQIQTSVNARVDSRRVYRSLVGGGTWYLAGTITDNVTLEFYDGIADANLTAELETDHGIPPAGNIVVSYKDRLFLTGDPNYPNRVYFSEASKPDMWPSTYYIDVGTSDDAVLGIVEFEGKLYFMQSKTITGFYGSDPDTFSWHKTRSHVGVLAPRSVAAGPDGIYFLSHDAVYRFDGLKSVSISDSIDKIFQDFEDYYVELLKKSDLVDNTEGVFLHGKYYLSVPMWYRGYTIGINRLLVYDAFGQVWTKQMINNYAIFAHEGDGVLYGSIIAPDASKSSVYELFSVSTHTMETDISYQKPLPFFATKAYPIAQEGKAVGWVRRFRVDCVGTWSVAFYVDGELVHTETLTNVTEADRYKWYSFPGKIKGRYIYVQATAGGYPRPDNCEFRELEIK